MNLNNKNKSINDSMLVFGLIFVFMFIIVLVPLFNRGTHSTDVVEGNTDTLVLSCPETAIAGEMVECDIFLNSGTIITQGLTVKYNLPVGVEYVNFNTDTFEVYSNDENGIVPKTIVKKVHENIEITKAVETESIEEYIATEDISKEIEKLKGQMQAAAYELKFELAAQLRDRISELEAKLSGNK